MPIADVLIMYTPLIQFGVIYLLLYRHDLLRFLHPPREMSGLGTWSLVLQQICLWKGDARPSGSMRRKVVVAIDLALPTALLSLISILIVLPLLRNVFPILSGLGTAPLDLLQFIPAAYLSAFLSRFYLGPLPQPPRTVQLRYPRLGSRVRHLGRPRMKMNGVKAS